MIQPGDRIIVGLSGGADSTALLHVLKELRPSMGLDIAAAHINHGLRGRAADEDALFCSELCKGFGIPFYLKSADIREIASSRKMTEEEAGRAVRYEFFEEVVQRTGPAKIATAHHKNDQSETILHNIIRGSGLKGLGGIRPVRDGRFIRPLIEVTRDEILAFLEKNGLTYRVDATNLDNAYTRNRIRNMLIPLIEKEFNPAFQEALARLGDSAREDEEFLDTMARKCLAESVELDGGKAAIRIGIFAGYHSAMQKRILMICLNAAAPGLKDITRRSLEDTQKLVLNGRTGAVLELPNGIEARKAYDWCYIEQKAPKTEISSFDAPLTVPGSVYLPEAGALVTCTQADRAAFSDNPACIFIDGGKVKGVLRVRRRRQGDRFQPLGMSGTKKLKDFFIDKKIPRSERDRIPLVVDDDNIIWVAGCQMSEGYKVDNRTEHILKLTVEYIE